jgi:HSP20 family protein
MTLYVTNPQAVMEARRRMMRRMFEENFNEERVMSFPVDLSETSEEYTLKAFLPGLSAEDVNIEYNNNTLSINGEYKAEEEDKSEKLLNEFPAGRFGRSFELAEPIVVDKIEASMSNGVLTVRIPKAEEAKPRTIKIVAK